MAAQQYVAKRVCGPVAGAVNVRSFVLNLATGRYVRNPNPMPGWSPVDFPNPQAARSYAGHVARVVSPFFKTDSTAHWSDYGAKSFFGLMRKSLSAAKAWASEQYGITEWSRNRIGQYVPKIVNDRFPLEES